MKVADKYEAIQAHATTLFNELLSIEDSLGTEHPEAFAMRAHWYSVKTILDMLTKGKAASEDADDKLLTHRLVIGHRTAEREVLIDTVKRCEREEY